MQVDKVVQLGKTVIHQGEFNDRVYLMKLDKDDHPLVISQIEKLALDKGYTKIMAKVPCFAKESFLENGYSQEAEIPGAYQGEPVCFMSKFLSKSRQNNIPLKNIKKILALAKNQETLKEEASLGQNFHCQSENDVNQMAEVYKEVFATYPFPITKASYLHEAIQDNVKFLSVRNEKRKIVSIASAEMDRKSKSVEMTDFATLEDFRGNGFAKVLLQRLEKEMARLGFKTAYSIARSLSYGMNLTFARLGYAFGGTLINNTNIGGEIESMNVWYKQI